MGIDNGIYANYSAFVGNVLDYAQSTASPYPYYEYRNGNDTDTEMRYLYSYPYLIPGGVTGNNISTIDSSPLGTVYMDGNVSLQYNYTQWDPSNTGKVLDNTAFLTGGIPFFWTPDLAWPPFGPDQFTSSTIHCNGRALTVQNPRRDGNPAYTRAFTLGFIPTNA